LLHNYRKKGAYQSFGPMLASKKLFEREGIKVSKETIRKIMITEGLHTPKLRRKDKVHPLRERRHRRGELVQIDGSYHAWLEDQAEKACLLLFIDDATSEILAAEFVEHERYWTYASLCASVISVNMACQKPSMRTVSVFLGSTTPMRPLQTHKPCSKER